MTGFLVAALLAAGLAVGSNIFSKLYPNEMLASKGKRNDAVLVFGSSGKMGRSIVQQVAFATCHYAKGSLAKLQVEL